VSRLPFSSDEVAFFSAPAAQSSKSTGARDHHPAWASTETSAMPETIAKPARSLLAPATANNPVHRFPDRTILGKNRCLVSPD
jgi:hypothetical protein